MKSTSSLIELLEHRIAPAAIFVNPTTATYTDVDGDLVTVKFSKAFLTVANLPTILGTSASGLGDHLDSISMTGVPGTEGTGIMVSVKLAGQGDGLADVGHILTNVNLGAVSIQGDLNQIGAGVSTNNTQVGVKSLTVRSFGLATYLAGAGQASSHLYGALGSLSVKTEFAGADLNVKGNIGSITIGGSVVAPTTGFGGSIVAQGDIGPLKIGGAIYGGVSDGAGQIKADGKIGNVTVGGSIHGGTVQNTGLIQAGQSIGTVKIAHDLTGRGAANAGTVSAGTTMGAVTVGGSVIGGGLIATGKLTSVKIAHDLQGIQTINTGVVFGGAGLGPVTVGGNLFGGVGDRSGAIVSHGNIGAVKIGGNVQGGGSDDNTSDSAQIATDGGNIASVTIGGDAIASFGDDNSNGSIIAAGTIGAVKIMGNIATVGDAAFVIRAQGSVAKPLAIASITVGRGVDHVLIEAGYDTTGVATFGGASIGAVKVGGNWFAGSIAAGVKTTPAANFGTNNDQVIGTPTLVSKIASITIGGEVSGTVGGPDHFGFVAQKIGALSVGGVKILLKATEIDSRPLGHTGDFLMHEVGVV